MGTEREHVQVVVNGETSTVIRGTTISQLLGQLGVPTGRVAVELNLSVIDQSRFDQLALDQGDRVEIVSFVGGGHG